MVDRSTATGSSRGARLCSLASASSAAALPGALVILPLALAQRPVYAPLWLAVIPAIVALVMALLVQARAVRSLAMDVSALALLVLCAALTWWITDAWGALAVAVLIGAAIGQLAPGIRVGTMRTVTLALAFAVLLAVLHRLVGDEATAACITVAGLLAIAAPRRGAGRPRIRGAWAALAAGVVAVLAVSWIGAHSAQAAWFGGLSSHGPRSSNEVALTFDDGPNPPYTDQIREVLARYGAVGTFFEVGQAVEASPDTVRALLAAGDVIGNHTYAHARWSYLDPRYPELARAQQTFTSTVERCPALFRPPHGTHTPWMSRVAGEHGLRVVTWDVEAADWTEDDPQRLARNILDRVQPGSIVLLHDGIDGHIGADRSVVVKALPLILEGLRARQLQAVSLDRLLNVPAYLPNCPA